MDENKLQEPRRVYLLFAMCWIVYFSTYIGRLSYTSAMSQMLVDHVMVRTQAGFISTMFFIFYAAGQFINGFIADRCSSLRMVFAGLLVSGLSNLAMAALPFSSIMPVIWAVNGYAASMIWPPIIHIFVTYLRQETCSRCLTHISTTMPLGTLASYLLSAFLLSKFGWKAVFFGAGGFLLLISIVWILLFHMVDKPVLKTAPQELDRQPNAVPPGQVPFIRLIILPCILLILLPVMIHGALKDGVTTWVPTYLGETFGTSPALSVLASAILPVVNVTGAYAAQFVKMRCKMNEMKTSVIFYLIALIALLLLFLFVKVNMILSVVLLTVVTSSMYALNVIFISYIPMHFADTGHAASLSGFLNSIAYAGSAVSSCAVGWLVSGFGWSVTILSWCFIAAIALALCLLGVKSKVSQAGRSET